MSEHEKTDHWAALASVLGAEVVPEEPKPVADAASSSVEVVVPAPPAKPARPNPPAHRPSSGGDWDSLANELGVAGAPPPPPHAAPAAVVPKSIPLPPPPVAAPEVIEQLDLPEFGELAVQTERIEPYRPIEPIEMVESAEPAETFERVERIEFLSQDEEGPVEVVEEFDTVPDNGLPEEEKRPGRRRRRRRRGRGGREAAPQPAEGETAAAEPAAFAELPAEESFEVLVGEEGVAEGEPVVEQEPTEPDESRPRRRRRRGGRSRERDRGPRSEERESESHEIDEMADSFIPGEYGDEEAEGADEQQGAALLDEPSAEDEAELDDLGGFEEDDEDEGDEGDSPRIGFRNIPTWDDAMGYIVTKNMESRAKNPGGGRSSGGRGRGGRGNRRGRPEKR